MAVIISDHLYKKSTMRDLNGNIINMIDEADGGYIIRNRQVVNQEKWDAYQKDLADKREAALAATKQVESPNAAQRTQAPAQVIEQTNKVEQLEKKVEGMESKLDAILQALKKE